MTTPEQPVVDTLWQPPTTVDLLNTELAADGGQVAQPPTVPTPVVGGVCGWTRDDLVGVFACQRAKGHADAQVMTDVHIAMVDGQLLAVPEPAA